MFGIIGNPVSHSRSPLIHNTAFQHVGFDGVYVPLLVDNMDRFLDAFQGYQDIQGFSVTIPHKVRVLLEAEGIYGFKHCDCPLQGAWIACSAWHRHLKRAPR